MRRVSGRFSFGLLFSLLFANMLIGCAAQPVETAEERTERLSEADEAAEAIATPSDQQPAKTAQITNVETSGTPGAYTFSVTIKSPDTGCDAYANWWEVVSEDGSLLYRRILAHSHVDEQPFTRSGGPVAIEADQPVIVRVHMHPTGYSPIAMEGTVDDTFKLETLPASFSETLAAAEPQPSGCAF